MKTTFVDGTTPVVAEWLNEVNVVVFEVLGDGVNPPATLAEIKTNLNLDNVDNTSDIDKPVSTATQTALDLKQDSLPSQTGNNGKYLSTDGSNPVWQTVDALPAQATHAGEFLTTDGTNASWVDVQSNSTSFGLFEHSNTISTNYTITTGNNAVSSGPITINSGITVTVPAGSTWTII